MLLNKIFGHTTKIIYLHKYRILFSIKTYLWCRFFNEQPTDQWWHTHYFYRCISNLLCYGHLKNGLQIYYILLYDNNYDFQHLRDIFLFGWKLLGLTIFGKERSHRLIILYRLLGKFQILEVNCWTRTPIVSILALLRYHYIRTYL